jgi:hypothetical protein
MSGGVLDIPHARGMTPEKDVDRLSSRNDRAQQRRPRRQRQLTN